MSRQSAEQKAAESGAGNGDGDSIRIAVPESLAQVERAGILATLERLGGDKPRSAEALGISLKTLYSRLREYGSRSGD
jgi:DNA-binding NtrC family response regulator